MAESTNYSPPTVTVDGICLSVSGGKLRVLLIRRQTKPLKNRWALPGGYVARGETTGIALDRILDDKAGIKPSDIRHMEQLYTFDWVGHDPRGHAVTVTYLGLCDYFLPSPSSSHPTVKWFEIDDLPELAFDHSEFIDLARKRLGSKLQYTNIAFGLLPTRFTILQLQDVYEAVLGVKLDKRNFRKKIIATSMLKQTEMMTAGVSHRPARLYQFCHAALTETQQFIS